MQSLSAHVTGGRRQHRVTADQPLPPPPFPLWGSQRASPAGSASGTARRTPMAPPAGSSGSTRDVLLEEPDRGQPTGVGQLRQGRRERQPSADADRGVQRRRHDDRQAVLGAEGPRYLERRADSAEWSDLDHDDIGRAGDRDPQRVLGLAHRLVRRHRHRRRRRGPDRRAPAPAPRRWRRAARRTRRSPRRPRMPSGATLPGPRRRSSRRWRRPGSARPSRLTRRPSPPPARCPPTRVWPASATLILAVVAPGKRASTAATCVGRHRGDGRVDRHVLADGHRPLPPAALDRRRQPAGRLQVVVLGERAELTPAGRSTQHEHLALQQPAEPHPHRQSHHVGRVLQVGQRREPGRRDSGAGTTGPTGTTGTTGQPCGLSSPT